MLKFLKNLFSKNQTEIGPLGLLRGSQLATTISGNRIFAGELTVASGIVVSGVTVIQSNATINTTSLPVATSELLGAIKIGTGLSIVSGVLSTAGSSSVVKFTTSIGDGSSTDIIVTHNLGTRDLALTVLDNGTYEYVLPDVFFTSTNSITLGFGVAPSVNQYRVIIVG